MSQLTQTSTDELVDIREVTVDKDLPKEERIAAFLHQIKNPYRFRCGDFVVNAEYSARDCAPQPLKLSIHSGGIEHPCRCR